MENLEENDRLQEEIGGSAILWCCQHDVFLTIHASWL